VGHLDLWVDLAYMLGMLPLRAWLYSGYHVCVDEGVVGMRAGSGVAIMVPLHLVLLVASGLLGARPQCF
jgi:hypothetical protein